MLVVDDGLLIREGIRQVLVAAGCDVVAVAGDVAEMMETLTRESDVDAVVLDIRMPPTHTDEGLKALEDLRASGSHLGVVLLSMYGSPTLAIRATAAGAGTGYLLKDRVTDADMLVRAVRTVMGGGTVVDPEVVAQLVSPAHPRSDLRRLTDREREVLRLMAEGSSNLGIAGRLVLSPKTVESHVAAIMTKLRIESVREEHRRVLAVLRLLRASE
ncbi:response regulator transcription factor [Naasia lichenicola]|uniref:Response regulator transcription factor n=1 Tax=Naasia lichenicola TaxID=2565933 RepID=A0A4S4FNI6_9MICO|nr:response regulator transcription factor [Naasia lichenicola]